MTENEKKQIEEMALVLSEGGCGKECDCIEGDKFNCHLLHSASVLYNADYRKQEWISVEERLPEDDGFVLLCTSKGAIIKGHYEQKYGRWSGLNNRLNVTHWMPLPEAPKMKGGDEE